MRLEIVALLLAFALLLPGCLGSGPAAPDGGESLAAESEGAPQQQPVIPPEAGKLDESTAQAGDPASAPNKNASAPQVANQSNGTNATASSQPANAAAHVNYCYPTYWKGVLKGTGQNDFYFDYCGRYNYSMQIDVRFTVPFDLAAYLAGKSFNFDSCPGMPTGAANGSRDISIDGRFNSTREITSNITNRFERMPDTASTSTGAMYISQPYGLVFASYPRQHAQVSARGKIEYPHLVPARCTWGGGIQVLGYDEVLVLGADAGGFSMSGDMLTVRGKWAMNGTLAGNYTLERTN